MPRMAPIVVPDVPHYFTQRGNRREGDKEVPALVRRPGRTGRPCCDPRLLARLEKQLSRRLAPRRPGRPRKGQ